MSPSDALDLNDLLVFAAVAEAGSFTAAADRLGSSKARVSQQLRRLEAGLGCQLLHRTTRRVALSEQGAALLDTSVPLLRQALDAIDHLSGSDQELRGSLRISCTVDHAVQTLSRHLAEFGDLHPGLRIELRTSDRIADLVREGIDVALRMGWLADSSLRAVRLGSFEQVVIAAPSYLRRAGTPARPQDLAVHDWIALTLLPAPLTWTFTSARRTTTTVRMSPRYRTDSAAGVRSLVEAGAGISVVGETGARAALREGRLIRLLPRWTLPQGGLHAVFPPGRHRSRPAQAFVAFYRAKMQGDAEA